MPSSWIQRREEEKMGEEEERGKDRTQRQTHTTQVSTLVPVSWSAMEPFLCVNSESLYRPGSPTHSPFHRICLQLAGNCDPRRPCQEPTWLPPAHPACQHRLRTDTELRVATYCERVFLCVFVCLCVCIWSSSLQLHVSFYHLVDLEC